MRMKEVELRQKYSRLSRKPIYKVKKNELMLPVSDGVKLKTVIFAPLGKESGAVILMRSCYYDSGKILQIHAEECCKRGFFFIYQWCRGIGASEGVWEPNIHERQDGLDTVCWICEQPFCESVGYWGDSYLAYTGWCMADAVPEKVKTMCLGVYGTDRHISAYQDGLFRQDILTAWAMENAGFPIEADYMESCLYRPQSDVDTALWGGELPWYREWIMNPDADADYWNQGIWKELKQIPSKIRIPLLIRDGWYDHHLGGAIAAWDNLSSEAASRSVLQIGPWNHDYKTAITQSTERLEDDSVKTPFEWFEKILMKKEIPRGEVNLYIIGADRWEKSSNLSSDTATTWYMDFSQKEDSRYLLTEKLENINESQVSFLYDPQNPVYSHGAESLFHTKAEVGSICQEKWGWRDDIISVVSKPFVSGVLVKGTIRVRLFVSSDAEDTAFCAKIMEVFKDGHSVNIRTGITTLAYRNHSRKRKDYRAGTCVEAEISMWPIAWEFQEGSSLRVDITSSDFPQYSIHTNYPGIWAEQGKTKTARQTLYSQKGKRCVVELPVVVEGRK